MFPSISFSVVCYMKETDLKNRLNLLLFHDFRATYRSDKITAHLLLTHTIPRKKKEKRENYAGQFTGSKET